MSLFAIDPGTTQSGYCTFDDNGRVVDADVVSNDYILSILRSEVAGPVVIEMMSSYGMPVGKEVLETLVWTGRFVEAKRSDVTRIFRKDVKLHLCHSARAKDANIWQAILDRYGGKEKAVGKKASPGPLYEVKSHARAALAVGLAWLDGLRSEGLNQEV